MYALILQGKQPQIFRKYKTRKGALIGMRAANRRCGWTRVSLCRGGIVEQEWCARSNGLPVYDYGPFVVAHEQQFKQWCENKEAA